MLSKLFRRLAKQLALVTVCLFLLAGFAHAQSDSEINLKGAFDFRVHSSPDSMDRSIDADDVAQLAKEAGMRGLVLKNHWDSTAALAYEVRRHVPGLEVFGGVVLNRSVGGINLEAVQHMAAMKGGVGKVVWMPTMDSQSFVTKLKENRPYVAVTRDGHVVPEVLEVIDFIAKHPDLVLETGHISGDEASMIIHEAHLRGVKHIVATNPTGIFVNMTPEQLKQAAADGAYLEFVYNSVIGKTPQRTIEVYANSIKTVGPKYCLLGSDFGGAGPNAPKYYHPQALLNFMIALHKEGISVDDINLMAKVNPAIALGLKP
jgi:uncharacterized protein DUF6282